MIYNLLSFTILSAVLVSISVTGCEKLAGNDLEFVENAVKDNLIDPSSAQFKNIVFYESTKGACGLVNSKNKFGGYVGFKRFVLKQSKEVMFDPEIDRTNIPSLHFPKFSSDHFSNADSLMRAQKQFEAEMREYQNNLNIQKAFEEAVKQFCSNNDSSVKESSSEQSKKGSENQCSAWENRDGVFVQVKSKCD